MVEGFRVSCDVLGNEGADYSDDHSGQYRNGKAISSQISAF